jgi:hypothetical protein
MLKRRLSAVILLILAFFIGNFVYSQSVLVHSIIMHSLFNGRAQSVVHEAEPIVLLTVNALLTIYEEA